MISENAFKPLTNNQASVSRHALTLADLGWEALDELARARKQRSLAKIRAKQNVYLKSLFKHSTELIRRAFCVMDDVD